MTVPLSLELLSPEIVSVSENKELLRHFRVYKSKNNKCTNGWLITTDGSLYTD